MVMAFLKSEQHKIKSTDIFSRGERGLTRCPRCSQMAHVAAHEAMHKALLLREGASDELFLGGACLFLVSRTTSNLSVLL